MLTFLIALLASTVGAICGIGGGVVIKPVLDLLAVASVSAISFLSGCTVLSMSMYSVGKALVAGDSRVDQKIGMPLAIGAAAGGIAGKWLFGFVKALFDNPDAVGGVQALCLSVITAGTLFFTINKQKIPTRCVSGMGACLLIGMSLGLSSSFLGIGGGPINLVVLYYFFSMDAKTAAFNSLYIILFSQSTSLLAAVLGGSVPEFEWLTLILMVCGGILGGIAGRKINKHIDSKAVEKLFVGMMTVIIGISVFNAWRYLAG